MDERPSFWRRADLRRVVIAILAPYVLFAVAYSLPLLDRTLYRSGVYLEAFGMIVILWFYAFGFAATLFVPACFPFGIWRLVWRRAYRRSNYGWVWLLLMYANLPGVVALSGH